MMFAITLTWMRVAQLRVNTNKDQVTHEKESAKQGHYNGERGWDRDGDLKDGLKPVRAS